MKLHILNYSCFTVFCAIAGYSFNSNAMDTHLPYPTQTTEVSNKKNINKGISSLREMSEATIINEVIAGRNIDEFAKLPYEQFEPILQQVIIQKGLAKPTIDEAVQEIKKLSQEYLDKGYGTPQGIDVNTSKEFALQVVDALAKRYELEFKQKAVSVMGRADLAPEKAIFIPITYTLYAVAHLESPVATQWFKETYRDKYGPLAVIDQKMVNIVHEPKFLSH